MFCKSCGQQIADDAKFCPSCGATVTSAPANQYAYQNSANTYTSKPADAPSTGMAILGFFFPLIGLILYLVWKDDQPLKAKSVGKGALIGFIVGIVVSIIIVIAYVVFMALLFSRYGY